MNANPDDKKPSATNLSQLFLSFFYPADTLWKKVGIVVLIIILIIISIIQWLGPDRVINFFESQKTAVEKPSPAAAPPDQEKTEQKKYTPPKGKVDNKRQPTKPPTTERTGGEQWPKPDYNK